jgi:antirestriction protein ArdC
LIGRQRAVGRSAAWSLLRTGETWLPSGYVAELGSAFLSADLGITPDVRDDHAAYIASWLEVLKNETHFIFTAASHAQRATDYLHGLQGKSSTVATEPEEAAV